MLRRTDVRIFVALGSAVVTALAACTVTTTENNTPGNKDAGSNSSTTSSTSSSGSTTSSSGSTSGSTSGATSSGSTSGSTSGANPATCGAKAKFLECSTCCGASDTTDAVRVKGYDDCACAGGCATQCQAWCATARQDAPPVACEQCLGSDPVIAACDPKSEEACQKDPTCKASADCEAAAKCEELPD